MLWVTMARWNLVLSQGQWVLSSEMWLRRVMKKENPQHRARAGGFFTTEPPGEAWSTKVQHPVESGVFENLDFFNFYKYNMIQMVSIV